MNFFHIFWKPKTVKKKSIADGENKGTQTRVKFGHEEK